MDHPNIVKFLGVYFITNTPTSNLPMLVMECLPILLSEFLQGTKSISNHTKYSISFGISLGLQYLHSQTPPIVHRDLTSKNILLTSNNIAKVADFGVSRIFKPEPNKQHVSMTPTPGNVCHMPPESLSLSTPYRQSPDHFDKLDIFSFGNVVLNIFTQEFPVPLSQYNEDGTPSSKTEVDRRQPLIDKITCPELKKLIKECLSNKQEMRPSTRDVVRFFKHALVNPVVSAMLSDKVQSLNNAANVLQSMPSMQALIAFVEQLHDRDINDGLLNAIEKSAHTYIQQKHTLDERTLQEYVEESQYVKAFSVLIMWMQSELDILQQFIKSAKDEGTLYMYNAYIFIYIAIGISIFNTNEEFMTIIEKTSVAYTICFNIENSQEIIMKKISCFINDYNINSLNEVEDEKNRATNKLKKQTENYIRFALANKTVTTNSTAICTKCTIDEQLCNIQLYTKSTNQFTPVTLPSKPLKPRVKNTTSTSITLSLEVPEPDDDDDDDGIVTVNISYLTAETESHTSTHAQWETQKASIGKDTCTVTVSNLKPKTSYLFKIAFQYHYGKSEDSDISEPITTMLGSPGKPEICRNGKNSVKVEWTEPELCGSMVDYYIVNYTTEGDQKTIKTAKTSVILSGLSAGCVYSCNIRGSGKSGAFEVSESRLFQLDSKEIGNYKYMYIQCKLMCPCNCAT